MERPAGAKALGSGKSSERPELAALEDFTDVAVYSIAYINRWAWLYSNKTYLHEQA